MAAVFALIFIPALAAIGSMVRSESSLTFGTAMAMLTFAVLTGSVFYGALRLVQGEENKSLH